MWWYDQTDVFKSLGQNINNKTPHNHDIPHLEVITFQAHIMTLLLSVMFLLDLLLWIVFCVHHVAFYVHHFSCVIFSKSSGNMYHWHKLAKIILYQIGFVCCLITTFFTTKGRMQYYTFFLASKASWEQLNIQNYLAEM